MIGLFLWLLPTLIYAAGYIFTFRRIAGQLAWHFAAMDRSKYPSLYAGKPYQPNGEQWFGSIISGLVLSIFWPASLPIAYGIAGARLGTGFFYVPSSQRERLYKERIAALEKEVGIR